MAAPLRYAGTAGLAGLAVVALGVRASEPPAPGRSAQRTTAAIHVFRSACLECHDGDGRGKSGRELFARIPDFTESRWQDTRTNTELSHSILEGKGKSMPRMKSK